MNSKYQHANYLINNALINLEINVYADNVNYFPIEPQECTFVISLEHHINAILKSESCTEYLLNDISAADSHFFPTSSDLLDSTDGKVSTPSKIVWLDRVVLLLKKLREKVSKMEEKVEKAITAGIDYLEKISKDGENEDSNGKTYKTLFVGIMLLIKLITLIATTSL